ncbi:MAG: undecaprenyl-phosphate glucose phosphotransferase [Paludibacter sp.]
MRSKDTELLFIYLFFDLCILNFSIIFLDWLDPSVSLWDYNDLVHYANYLLHANLSWILTYLILSKRNLHLRDGFLNRLKRITQRISIFVIISLILESLVMRPTFSNRFLLEYTMLFYVTKLVFYWFLYSYLDFKRKKGFHTDRALIIGVNDTCYQLRDMIDNNPILGYKFIGFVTSKPELQVDIIGHPEELPDLIEKYQIQIIFVTLSLLGESKGGRDYLNVCNKLGVRLRFIPENQRWIKSSIHMESVGELALINPQEIPLDKLDYRFLKRTFDLLFSGLFLMFVFTWLFPILAVLIKLNTKGPVFFIQKRTGINKKTFDCYKFRSMQVNDQADLIQATNGDSRITSVGLFLRKYNLDELPQFMNVFMGHMSVVGPRPHMLKHTAQYSELIDEYLVRHYVKPGVTGWAQVNGLRGETDELWKMEKRVQFDMEYIENWSFWWDIKIVLRTVFDKKTYNNAG